MKRIKWLQFTLFWLFNDISFLENDSFPKYKGTPEDYCVKIYLIHFILILLNN